ncbi:MAG: hypothetical protein EBU23_06470 [Mycobacteriaceae bacterium]|nr:hypothetical protein [Mycobacteriaceae bacterium]
MSTPTKPSAGVLTAALAASVVSAVALAPAAGADPTILDPGQMPGLAAVQSLSPVVQQAAVNPASAQQLLLAAASQLAGNATTPAGSAALADAVTKFVQQGGAADPAAALSVPGSPQAVTGTARKMRVWSDIALMVTFQIGPEPAGICHDWMGLSAAALKPAVGTAASSRHTTAVR